MVVLRTLELKSLCARTGQHLLHNDYGSGVVLLGSHLCGCLWERVSAQACLGRHPARNSLCTMCVTSLSSLCDWFPLNNIKGEVRQIWF